MAGPEEAPEGKGTRSRHRILDAAESLMATHGYAAVTIARLEAECGLPASSIYWHYGNKEGVLLAVMERGADRFLATAVRIDQIEGTPLARAHAIFQELTEHLTAHPQFLRLVLGLGFQHTGNGEALEVVAQVRARGLVFARQLSALIVEAAGQEVEEETLEAMGRLIMASADGLTFAAQLGEPVDVGALLPRLVPMLVAVAQTEGLPQGFRERRSG